MNTYIRDFRGTQLGWQLVTNLDDDYLPSFQPYSLLSLRTTISRFSTYYTCFWEIIGQEPISPKTPRILENSTSFSFSALLMHNNVYLSKLINHTFYLTLPMKFPILGVDTYPKTQIRLNVVTTFACMLFVLFFKVIPIETDTSGLFDLINSSIFIF